MTREEVARSGWADLQSLVSTADDRFVSAADKAYSIEDVRKRHPRAYERWSLEEDARLVSRYRELIASQTYWQAIKRLAVEHGRQRGGIRSRLLKLRIDVASLRPRIPDHVRQEVWIRDGAMCVDCGSRDALQFDHIIPVSKGGASTAENVELRCVSCTMRKADLI